jgi:hypothetical protein
VRRRAPEDVHSVPGRGELDAVGSQLSAQNCSPPRAVAEKHVMGAPSSVVPHSPTPGDEHGKILA